MVVLSVGLEPAKHTVAMAKRLGVEVDKYGFANTTRFTPHTTSKEGIYVCGVYQGPKDIPETVAQASGAAADAMAPLAMARGTMIVKKEYPPEIDVKDQEPRIGVFVCNCGINIGGVVNVPKVRDYARTLDNVVHVEDNLYTCSQDTQAKIQDAIKEHKLNRVIVASCSPRTHESMFRETVRQAGLNKYLFEMANIRDQCSWVHMKQKTEATEKAEDLVRMAVANARMIQPLGESALSVIHKAIVVGGGIAGMTSALKIADQGYEVYLLEKEDKLGGNLWNLHYTLDGQDVRALLESTIERVKNHPMIHVLMNASIVDSGGSKGNFTTGVKVRAEWRISENPARRHRRSHRGAGSEADRIPLRGRSAHRHPARTGKQDCRQVRRRRESEKGRDDSVRGLQKCRNGRTAAEPAAPRPSRTH